MCRHGRLLLLVLALEVGGNAPALFAQADSERQHVGIALAGGGAKGLAHIGVLRWMEEHRVPVDAIAGTSMGGLVGGMYAAGRDSHEIEEFVATIDWAAALSSRSPYSALAYRRKEDLRAFPATFELGFKKAKPQLPSGLNAGHQVGLLLDRIGFAYAALESFDELPTPFRCVAADLLSGEKVVFDQGSLSHSLRATMSLPAIFSPVESGDRLLVDGGIVDNIPADIVRSMDDVDVVIAVDLGMETLAQEAGLSLIGVAQRSIEIMIRRNELDSLTRADLVVEPAVLDFGTLQFRQVDVLIQRGYDAAEQLSAELSKYSVGEQEWQSFLTRRRSRVRDESLNPTFVSTNGFENDLGGSILKRLDKLGGSQLDRAKLESSLTRITGLGPFDAAGYYPVEKDGNPGVQVEVSPKKHGPPFIRPLFIMDSGQAGSASFTLAARISAYDTPTPRSEWRTDLSFGRINSAATEYYQYLGASGFFVAPRAFASREQQLIVIDGERFADYEVSRAGGGFDVGYNFGRFSEIRTGIEANHTDGKILIGLNLLPRVKGTERLWRTRWRVNALNSGAVPTRGFLIDANVDWQFASPKISFDFDPSILPDKADNFSQASLRTTYAREIAPSWSAIVRTLVGGTFQGNVQPFSEFRLGGPLRLSALEFGELRGANVAYGSVGGLKTLHDSPSSFVSKLYGAVFYEVGDAFESRPSWFHSGSAGVMAETNLGVLFVGVSYGEQGRGGFFFSVGRMFDPGLRDITQVR